MKKTLRLAGFAALATLGFAQVSHAADNFDLIMGFRSEATGDNDLLINLGDFQSVPGSVSLGNFNTALTAAFGAGWSSDQTIHWGIAAANISGTRVGIIANSGAAYGSMTIANVNTLTSKIGALYTPLASLSAGSSMTLSDADVNGWTLAKGADVFSAPISKVTNDRFELIGAGSTTLTRVTGSGLWTDLGNISFASNGDVTFAAVPEPSTYGLMGAGALAAAAFVRRRRKAIAKVA